MNDVELISSKTTNKFLSYDHLTAKWKKQEENIRNLKIKLADFNHKKKISVLNKKLSMRNRFIISLSEKDIPRLKQLISVCIRQENGLAYLLRMLQLAVEGLYSPKGYDQNEKNLAAFIMISGGPRLLHVLHH